MINKNINKESLKKELLNVKNDLNKTLKSLELVNDNIFYCDNEKEKIKLTKSKIFLEKTKDKELKKIEKIKLEIEKLDIKESKNKMVNNKYKNINDLLKYIDTINKLKNVEKQEIKDKKIDLQNDFFNFYDLNKTKEIKDSLKVKIKDSKDWLINYKINTILKHYFIKNNLDFKDNLNGLKWLSFKKQLLKLDKELLTLFFDLVVKSSNK